jgi:hypothetical protein
MSMPGGWPYWSNTTHLGGATMRLSLSAGWTNIVVAIGAAVVALLPTASLAHERRTIANGAYQVEVGWETEPALAV